MTVGVQTCLDLSYAVYGGGNISRIPDNWEQIDLNGDGIRNENDYCRNNSTGFAGAAYGLDANNDGIYEQIVIAYRGTERNGLGERAQDAYGNPVPDVPLSTDIMDVFTDSEIINGIVPNQFENPPLNPGPGAWSFYEDIKQLFPNTDITITGHSSGGALAQLVAAKALAEYGVANDTYTFNAPGVQAVLWEIGCPYPADDSFIKNFSVMNDWCGMFREHIGDLYILPPIEIEQSEDIDQQYFNSLTNTHEGIFNADFNMAISKPIGFNQEEGLSLWYYDVNNIFRGGVIPTPLADIVSAIVTQVSETALKNAINIINTEIGTPLHTLKYQITEGQIIIGDATGNEANTLQGTNSLLGLGGNDTIWGNEGDDSIIGGTGSDEIYGGADDDTIFGNDTIVSSGDGKNKLYGDGGNDKIIAGDNNDFIDGGSGDDTIVAGQGNDMIIGGTGDDHIYSGTGKSMLAGGEGNDTYHINMINGLSGSDFTGKDGIVFQTIDKTTIIDSDGIGSVIANGTTLTGGKQVEGSTDTYTDTLGFTYVLSGTTLTISNSNGSFVIKDFYNGDLGITLKDKDEAPIPPNIPVNSGVIDNYIYGQYAKDSNGNPTFIPLNEFLYGTILNDYINGNGGSDSIYAGAGDDYVLVNDGSYVDTGSGNNTVNTGSNSIVYGGSGNDIISCGNNSIIDTGNGNNMINANYSIITAGSGNDTIGTFLVSPFNPSVYQYYGNVSNDLINAGEGANYIMASNSTIKSGSGNDTIALGSNNLIDAGDGNNYIYFTYDSTINAGSGDDTIAYKLDSAGFSTGLISNNVINAGDGNNYIAAYNSTITSGSGDDTIIGAFGLAGENNIIDAGDGNNYIFQQNSTIIKAGVGNDIISLGYNYDNTNSVISDSGGIDTLNLPYYSLYLSSFDKKENDLIINGTLTIKNWFLSDNNKIETIRFGGEIVTSDQIDSFFIYGDENDNSLNGTGIGEYFDGGAGNDTILAGGGNDIIYGGDGNDVLKGEGGADTVYGGAGDDEIYNNPDLNYFYGGTGNDTYYIDSTENTIIEYDDEGIDLISSSVTHTLESNIENLTLTGNGAIDGIGNDLANVLIGNSANNILTGGAGADTLSGGGGNDYLNGGADNNTYIYNLGDGNDTIVDSGSNSTVILGSAITKNNIIFSKSDTDVLISFAGSDDSILLTNQIINSSISSLIFADGTTYTSGEIVNLAQNNIPTDTLISGVLTEDNSIVLDVLASAFDADGDIISLTSYTQGRNGTISVTQDNKLIYTPNENYNGTDSFTYTLSDGNGGVITKTVNLTINAVNDIPIATLIDANVDINSSVILDVLANAYDADGDPLLINSYTQGVNGTITMNENNQLVYTPNADYSGNDSFTYTISDGNGGLVTQTINLTVGTLPTYITGDNEDNVLIGNSQDNIIDGGAGADTMIGGAGNDTYFVDNIDDLIIENYDEGWDQVNSSVTYTLGANVDDLILTGTEAINGYGNDLDNFILGNSADNLLVGGAGNDIIDGGAGADTMIGGFGDDIYYVDDVNDVIIENSGEGKETVYSSVSYTLPSAVDNLTLIENEAINGTGNSTNNVIIGNSAANKLYGGGGNDKIYGGDGKDTIDGGIGADTMIGGGYSDTYYVDNVDDVIIEDANGGTSDIVYSSVTYTLSNNVENLTLTGSESINATGNSLDNYIKGNSADNRISSKSGNDTIDAGLGNDTLLGGAGNDSLIGGGGNDTYQFGSGNGNDIITDTSGDDAILFDGTVGKSNIAMYIDSNNNLIIDYGSDLGSDQITVLSQSTNTIEQIKLSDGEYITSTEINSLIQNMTAYATSNSIEFTGISDVKNNQDLMNLVSSSWHS